ncbi:MAG: hypothetical protein JWO20_96 [Candidatus Angelobacter sp.]|nr:hypothetical protein [Candidatus Angelobacter sp.]
MLEETTFDVKLETDSNLWPSVARKNCSELALPSEYVTTHELKLKALVSRRNDIAHGKRMIIKTLSDYQPYEEAALQTMHELAIAVLEALESKSHLKAVPTPEVNIAADQLAGT